MVWGTKALIQGSLIQLLREAYWTPVSAMGLMRTMKLAVAAVAAVAELQLSLFAVKYATITVPLCQIAVGFGLQQ